MDRRDFLKMGALGGIAGGLSALGGNVALPGSAVAAGKGDSAARDAMQALLAALDETQATHLSTLTDPDDIGEGQRAMAHILHTGLFFFLEADPERPVFKTYVTPTRKLLGDNPDSGSRAMSAARPSPRSRWREGARRGMRPVHRSPPWRTTTWRSQKTAASRSP
jgi:hypothetical protein